MYGQYREDLSQFAKCEARRSSALPDAIEKDAASIPREARKESSSLAKKKVSGS